MSSVVDTEPEIQPRKTKTESADLDITPMIDITFLLLAFFIMVSKMDPQISVDLPTAQNGQSIPEKNCVVFVVVPGDTPDTAKIYKGRSKDESDLIQAAEAIEVESQIADYVEDQLSRNPSIQGILIKAEGDVRHGDVERVRRGISQSKLAETRPLYAGVDEQQ